MFKETHVVLRYGGAPCVCRAGEAFGIRFAEAAQGALTAEPKGATIQATYTHFCYDTHTFTQQPFDVVRSAKNTGGYFNFTTSEATSARFAQGRPSAGSA